MPAGSLLDRALDWVWRASLAGAFLTALVLVLQFVLGKKLPPRWRYGLWLLVVARLLMPVAPTSSFSVFNWIEWRSQTAPAPASVVSSDAHGAGETPALRSAGSSLAPDRDALTRTESDALSGKAAIHGTALSLRTVLAWAWLAGVAGYWLFVLVQHWRFAARLKHEHPVTDGRILALLEACKAELRLRTSVRLLETTRVSTPAVFGYFRPRLLLPKALLDTWDTPELRHVILHELVHIRRRDVLLNWVLIFAQGLHWFNPAVWFALRRLRAEREVLCDAIVLSHLQSHRASRLRGDAAQTCPRHFQSRPAAEPGARP